MKKILILMLMFLTSFLISGCELKRDKLENVDIYTTVYPIEFIADSLYGDNARVYSIYPAEVNIEEYSLTEKQIATYSKCALFIYNGLTNEKIIARDMLNANTNLKLIDVSQGLEYEHSIEELWLNPRDYLMLAHNVKNGLEEYITNKYIIEEIEKDYENLKILVSGFDAELNAMSLNAEDNNIIIGSTALSFLEKYGFSITNIDNSKEEVPSAIISKAKRLINEKKVKFIFILDNQEETKEIKDLAALGAKVVKLRTMTIKTESDITNGVTYKNMMQETLDALKKEVYE